MVGFKIQHDHSKLNENNVGTLYSAGGRIRILRHHLRFFFHLIGLFIRCYYRLTQNYENELKIWRWTKIWPTFTIFRNVWTLCLNSKKIKYISKPIGSQVPPQTEIKPKSWNWQFSTIGRYCCTIYLLKGGQVGSLFLLSLQDVIDGLGNMYFDDRFWALANSTWPVVGVVGGGASCC